MTAARQLPPVDYLKTRVSYDPLSGLLTWLLPPPGPTKAGDTAGWGGRGRKGYLKVMIDGENYLVHRVAWKLQTGEEPPPIIDHADGEVRHNQWSNLREASVSANAANKRLTVQNSSGYKGVCFDKFTNKWVAHLRKDGKLHNLGRFATPEQGNDRGGSGLLARACC